MFNRKPFKANELPFAPLKLSAYAIAQKSKQHDNFDYPNSIWKDKASVSNISLSAGLP